MSPGVGFSLKMQEKIWNAREEHAESFRDSRSKPVGLVEGLEDF